VSARIDALYGYVENKNDILESVTTPRTDKSPNRGPDPNSPWYEQVARAVASEFILVLGRVVPNLAHLVDHADDTHTPGLHHFVRERMLEVLGAGFDDDIACGPWVSGLLKQNRGGHVPVGQACRGCRIVARRMGNCHPRFSRTDVAGRKLRTHARRSLRVRHGVSWTVCAVSTGSSALGHHLLQRVATRTSGTGRRNQARALDGQLRHSTASLSRVEPALERTSGPFRSDP